MFKYTQKETHSVETVAFSIYLDKQIFYFLGILSHENM